MYAYGAVWNRGIWRLLFLIGAMMSVVDALNIVTFPGPSATIRYSFSTYAQPLLNLAMVVVASLASEDTRDWVHWLGVLVYCMAIGGAVLGFLAVAS